MRLRQLQGMDASFVALETRNSPMHIGSLLIYNPGTAPGTNPAALLAVADRLIPPEGEWKPFEPPGLAGMLFPKTRLH